MEHAAAAAGDVAASARTHAAEQLPSAAAEAVAACRQRRWCIVDIPVAGLGVVRGAAAAAAVGADTSVADGAAELVDAAALDSLEYTPVQSRGTYVAVGVAAAWVCQRECRAHSHAASARVGVGPAYPDIACWCDRTASATWPAAEHIPAGIHLAGGIAAGASDGVVDVAAFEGVGAAEGEADAGASAAACHPALAAAGASAGAGPGRGSVDSMGEGPCWAPAADFGSQNTPAADWGTAPQPTCWASCGAAGMSLPKPAQPAVSAVAVAPAAPSAVAAASVVP